MNLKAYGTEMLEKQLKMAEKKGNKDYAEMLKAEIAKRASAPKRRSTSRPANVNAEDKPAGETHGQDKNGADNQPPKSEESAAPADPVTDLVSGSEPGAENDEAPATSDSGDAADAPNEPVE